MSGKRWKILHLTYNYKSERNDVIQEVVRGFAREPDVEIHEAYMCGHPSRDGERPAASEYIHFFDFKKKELGGFRLKIAAKIADYCQQHGINVVITHRYKPAHAVALANRRCHFEKVFYVSRGLGEYARLGRRIFARLLQVDKAVHVGCSQAVADDLLKTGFGLVPAQCHGLNNAIDIPLHERALLERSAVRRELGLSEDEFVFGHIGRMVEAKGQDHLLRAFAQVRQTFPASRLVIIGDGYLEAKLKALAQELGLGTSVLFTGNRPEAFRYVRGFDAFVVSSIYEGFGLVILEAMVAALPVITTDAGGIPAVVQGSAALMVPKADEPALVQAMQRLAAMPPAERQALGQALRAHLEEHFSIPRYHRDWVALFRRHMRD